MRAATQQVLDGCWHHCLRSRSIPTPPSLNPSDLYPALPSHQAEGKFPAGMCAKDFVRLEAADAVPDESGWTDQETLLLLEGGL